MMSKEKRRVPKLRFPGFTEDWEQRKLGDYLTIPEKEILEVASVNDLITVKLNLGGVESGASRDTLSLGSTVYYKRYAGQFIYGKQNFFNGSMGLIPKNLDGKGSSGDVPSFNVSNIEANYLYTYVSRESYWRLKVAAASGTGSKRIHEKTFLDFNIDVPSLDEQKLISNTFDLVNRFITLHQRKLNNLKLKKKALLQKLFPKNGERYPELRFSGFTDAWEQRKLGDVADVRDGTHDSPKFYNDGFPLVTSKNLKDGSIDFSDCSFISKQDFDEINKRSKVDSGDILFGMIGTIGNPAIVEHTGFAIKNVALIKEGIIVNNRFIYHLLSSKVFDNYIARENAGGTQKFIALNQIRNFIFLAPTLEEQNKIIELLDYISQTITLHQQEPFLCGNSVNGGVELC